MYIYIPELYKLLLVLFRVQTPPTLIILIVLLLKYQLQDGERGAVFRV